VVVKKYKQTELKPKISLKYKSKLNKAIKEKHISRMQLEKTLLDSEQ